ncbi:MAG: carboxypeptidase-like regulatory domain-containing protein, partial [Cellulophaga sp.]|nr:carboxypeptidase-like regulatory domain-containing protein [Cellulophaga sp.]
MKKILQKPIQILGRSKSLLVVFVFFLSISAMAQKTITGTILDENGTPIPAVNVLQKGTTNGTAADFDGNFSITLVAGENALIFSSIGFKTNELALGAATNINVTLVEDSEQLQEVVVIGFQKVEREKVLGSTVGVSSESLQQAAPVDLLQGIQG